MFYKVTLHPGSDFPVAAEPHVEQTEIIISQWRFTFEPTSGQKRFEHMDLWLKVYLERHKNPGNVSMLLLHSLVDCSAATRAPF